jgi:hypothetical protein
MYKLRGRVNSQNREELKSKKGETFEKLTFIITETDTGFDHKYQFEIFGESSINLLADYVKDDRMVKIEFYIKVNEWKDKFFYTLVPKHIQLEDELTLPETLHETEQEKEMPF